MLAVQNIFFPKAMTKAAPKVAKQISVYIRILFWTIVYIIVFIIICRRIIIIITLLQEDNIFGTSASLTYGPQLQSKLCLFENKSDNYLQYV